MSILDAIAGERRYGAPRDRTRADIENLNPVNILDSVFRPSRNPNTGQVQYKHDATYQAIVSEVNEQYSKNTGRRFNDSMSVGEMRELLDTIDVPKGVRVTATKQGEYFFHYQGVYNNDKPLKLDPEAVQLAYASGAFKWDAPLPSVAQQATRGNATMTDEMEDKLRADTAGTGITVTRVDANGKAVAPREMTAEKMNDRPAIYAREDAQRASVAPATAARNTNEPAAAVTVAAMPAPQPAPVAAAPVAAAPVAAAPVAAAPQMAAPSAAPDIFNRIAGEIGSAGQVRTANDDARAVEAFLKANPVIGADGKPITDTRAGFKDDGILSEQEATAALNRAQALRWSTDGKAAEALAALETSLNPASTRAPVQAQASTEVTTATAEPAAKGPANLLEGVNGFDKALADRALAEVKAVRAEMQTAVVMDNTTLVGGADQAAPKSSPVLASVQSSGMGASV